MSATTQVRYRFAFDIGGTFTDLVLLGSDGTVHTAKVLSDQTHIVAPIRAGLMQMLEQHGIALSAISDAVVGATTAVTNLVIERKGARTGLIATAGFRDVIEIARELRFDLYDLTTPGPDPIIERALRVEVDERVDAAGRVVIAAQDADIERAISTLAQAGVQAIAVCFLHSFANPAHEQRVKAIAARVAPSIAISLSSEVLGELREYERTVATVLNAYVMPMVGPYLREIEDGLRAIGLNTTLRVMQSNGGVISRAFGERMPIRLLESGPAAGALGAAHAATLAQVPDVIAFDMGGTTAKACLVSGGKPTVTTDFEAARLQRFKKGSGLPVRLPTIDLIEIGAGGGSIAHVDRNGMLKIGPHSAGSNPGPACYGLGGTQPTVTDAALLLGYLDPKGNLSGAVRLRAELAERAIDEHIARPLRMSVIEAANGIHRIVCEHMAAAAKIHAVEKGCDVRRFTLLAFGGAGPIHAREVARRAGCTQVLVPANAGVFSAFGLLVAPMKVDTVRTRFARLAELDWDATEALLVSMQQQVRAELASADVAADQIRFRRTADMRYVGQGFEVETELPARLDASLLAQLQQRFNEAYAASFGKHLEGQRIEALNWRVEGFAPAPATPAHRAASAAAGSASGAASGAATGAATGAQSGSATDASACAKAGATRRTRDAFFPDLNCFVATPVIAEADLVPEQTRDGPALIEQAGSTVVVGPGDSYLLDRGGNLRIRLGAAVSRNQGAR